MIDKRTQSTGETIIHFEDGSYRRIDTEDVYNHINQEYKCEEIEEWICPKYSEETGKLYIMIKYKDGRETLIDAEIIRCDDPSHLALYIYDHPIERLRSGYWNDWSRTTLTDTSKIIRRIKSMYKHGNYHYTRAHFSRVRRLHKSKYIRKRQTQFGVLVPIDVRDAELLDAQNKNHKWGDSIKKEMKGIMDHKTFLFLPPGSKPPEGYQEGPLQVIFSVKPNLRCKARLVLGGH